MEKKFDGISGTIEVLFFSTFGIYREGILKMRNNQRDNYPDELTPKRDLA